MSFGCVALSLRVCTTGFLPQGSAIELARFLTNPDSEPALLLKLIRREIWESGAKRIVLAVLKVGFSSNIQVDVGARLSSLICFVMTHP